MLAITMLKLGERSQRFFRVVISRPMARAQQHSESECDRRWAKLIERMGQADLQALSDLYDESSTLIFGFVLEILHDRQAAEATLIEIYDHARQNAARFARSKQTAVNWLIELARDIATLQLRKTAETEPMFDFFRRKREMAKRVLDEISAEQREILQMTYLCGLTAAEVASVLGADPEYVAAQIVSGMKQLSNAAAAFTAFNAPDEKVQQISRNDECHLTDGNPRPIPLVQITRPATINRAVTRH